MTALLGWCLALALRSTIVLAVALALSSALRGRRAAARHRLLTFACVSLLALPLLGRVLPRWELPLPSTALDRSAGPALESAGIPAAVAIPRGAGLLAPTPAVSREVSPVGAGVDASRPRVDALAAARDLARSTGVAVATTWALGSTLSLLGLATALRRERRLRARSQALGGAWAGLLDELRSTIGVSRAVQLLVCPAAEEPMTVGWRRPCVLVPASAEAWSDERRRVVLQHELVHVLRGDSLRTLLWRAVTALYWFNPLARIAEREARAVREQACDEAVMRLGTRPSAYARHLLEIAEAVTLGRRPLAHALPMVEKSQLARRLQMILDDRRHSASSRWPAVVAVAALAGTVALVAAASPVPPVGPVASAIPARPAAFAAAAPALASAPESEGAAPRVCLARLTDSFSGSMSEGPDGATWVGEEHGTFTLQQDLGPGRRLCARVVGGARLDENDGSIRDLPSGSTVVVETRGKSGSQVMRVTGAPGGPRHEWWIGGAPRPVDDAARAWLSDALAVVAAYRAIGGIQGEVGGLQGEIGGIQGQVGGLQGEIGGIQGRIGGLQGEIGAIEGERGALEGRIGGEEGAIGGLEGRRWQASEAERSRIDAEIASHRRTIEKLQAEMKSRRFEERIAEAEAGLKGDESKAQAEIAELERRIADIHADQKIAELERKIEGLRADERIAEIERRTKPVIERLGAAIDRLRS